MSGQLRQPDNSRATDDQHAVEALYQGLLTSWNNRDAVAFADPFGADGSLVGFDGTMLTGQLQIAASIQQIFDDHVTASYVGKIREVRFLAPHVALLRAVAGMAPPGQADLNPAVNTIQALIAVKDEVAWRIVLYQNTPAQFHGRPELVEQLTDELRQLLP